MKNRTIFMLLILVIVAVGLAVYVGWPSKSEQQASNSSNQSTELAKAGSTFVTYLNCEGSGKVAVQIKLPKDSRYDSGAPIVVHVPTSFTENVSDFPGLDQITDNGFIEITLVFPGKETRDGFQSEGENDYGGDLAKVALRDTIKFAGGQISNIDGKKLDELIAIQPDYDNLGVYAFSHPGIIATAVLALYGDEMNVKYFVGRENPTEPLISAVEIGHFVGDRPVQNPVYDYSSDYSADGLKLDYSAIAWSKKFGVPYFDVNSNGQEDPSTDYILGNQIPTMFGKHVYSTEMLKALQAIGLTGSLWPDDLADPETASELWPERSTLTYYPMLKDLKNDLHVMLLFGERDHVQPALDKPHVHQAYDAFRAAGFWTRLNPDQSYVLDQDKRLGAVTPELAANTEPDNWGEAYKWGYGEDFGSIHLIPLAALSEMADRTHNGNWSENLSNILD